MNLRVLYSTVQYSYWTVSPSFQEEYSTVLYSNNMTTTRMITVPPRTTTTTTTITTMKLLLVITLAALATSRNCRPAYHVSAFSSLATPTTKKVQQPSSQSPWVPSSSSQCQSSPAVLCHPLSSVPSKSLSSTRQTNHQSRFSSSDKLFVTGTTTALSMAAGGGESDNTGNKLPFWLDPNTRGGAIVLSLILFVIPFIAYSVATGVFHVDEVEAGKWIGVGFTAGASFLWVFTYIFRVATKDMTYVRTNLCRVLGARCVMTTLVLSTASKMTEYMSQTDHFPKIFH